MGMARGKSGRIVLEIDPSEKVALYSAINEDGMTLKDWFLKQASRYLLERSQLPLFGASVAAEELTTYRDKSKPARGSLPKKKQPRGKSTAR